MGSRHANEACAVNSTLTEWVSHESTQSRPLMKLSLAIARTLLVAIPLAAAGSVNAQPSYPNRPIHIIVPFAPGGSNDLLARLFAPKMTANWGQPVVVENRGGGSTVIGTEAVVKSAPDGYTILFMNMAHVTTPLLVATPYDPIKDFTMIATSAKSEYMLALHPSLPPKTLKEFVALAKSRPGQLNYASSGAGGATHLVTELFCMMTGTKMQHIPYKGGAPALVDLISGQVQVAINVPVNFVQHIKSGRLKSLAITGENRFPALAQVPTFAEAGLQGFDAKVWYGVLAPAGTPQDIVDKLSAEFSRIIGLPEIREKLLSNGMDPFLSTPGQFAALMREDLARFAKVVKTANIKLSN